MEGHKNIQASLKDCASSCDRHANATAFTWCDVQVCPGVCCVPQLG